MTASPRPGAYVVDPADPRAPPTEVWDAMTPDERARVLAALPSEVPTVYVAEGDPHRKSKERALDTLRGYFRRMRRSVYLSSELAIYYPGESMFAPDLIAVLDVEDRERDSWSVSAEGRGLDLAIEIVVRGDWRKDAELNVERYARLGIREYFIFDARRKRILGYVLPDGATAYRALVPQAGRWPSAVLGLDLAMDEHGRLRFHQGTALVLASDELLEQANLILGDVLDRTEELARELEREQERAEAEAARANREAERAGVLAAQLRALGVEPEDPG